MITYHAGQGYRAARGLRGFPGLVSFPRIRRGVELELIGELAIDTHVIDVTARDRDAHHREIDTIVERLVGSSRCPPG